MTYFWTIQEHVPDGLGFRLFGIAICCGWAGSFWQCWRLP